jgi:hypothetical protein
MKQAQVEPAEAYVGWSKDTTARRKLVFGVDKDLSSRHKLISNETSLRRAAPSLRGAE